MEIKKLKDTERFEIFENVLKLSSDYFEAIRQHMELNNPDLYKTFTRLQTEAATAIKAAHDLAGRISSLDDVVKFYTLSGEIQSALEQLVDIVKNPYYADLITIDKSMTYKMQIQQVKINLQNGLANYKRIVEVEDREIFQQVAEALDVKTNYESIINDIRKYEAPNRLLIYIMKAILNVVDAENLLRGKIEHFKDNIISTKHDLSPAMAQSADTPLSWQVFRRGLIPTTPYLSVGDLLRECFGYAHDDASSLVDNLDKATGRHSVLIIHKHVGKEIDFNVLPIIDTAYIEKHKLYTNRNNGLNKMIWRRFDTIRDVTSDKTPTPPRNYTEIDNKTPRWLLLENTGALYRVLGRAFGDLYVDKEIVDQIRNGVTQRPEAYHDICEYYILNRGGEARGRDIVRWFDEMKLKTTPTEGMKQNMLDELVQSFTPDESWLGENGVEKFAQACRTGYQRVVSRHLIRYLEAEKITSREVKVSFAIKLDDIFREFRRRLETSIRKFVHGGLFTKRAKYGEHLRMIYRDVMNDVIQDMDSAPSKWQSLEMTLKEFYIEYRHVNV